MRCYYLLVHGKLDWHIASSGDHVSQPQGFYCHRYVFAINEHRAATIAFQRVRSNLDDKFGWLRDRKATLTLETEEIHAAHFYRLLKPDNKGHTFYEQD